MLVCLVERKPRARPKVIHSGSARQQNWNKPSLYTGDRRSRIGEPGRGQTLGSKQELSQKYKPEVKPGDQEAGQGKPHR